MDKSLDQSWQNGDYQKLEAKYYQNLNELTALKQENNMLRFQIEDFNLKLRESDGDIRLIQEKIRKMKRNKIDSTVKRDSKAFSQNKESIRNSNQKRKTTKDFIDSKSKPATVSRSTSPSYFISCKSLKKSLSSKSGNVDLESLTLNFSFRLYTSSLFTSSSVLSPIILPEKSGFCTEE